MLTITHLKKEYAIEKKTFCALNDLNLNFPKVQFAAVLGPSGCGKTTLLNCIGGLDSFTSGDIQIDGKSLLTMSEEEHNSYRNNYIGFVFQNYYLIPQLTVLENIKVALAVRDYSQKEIDRLCKEALKRVGLEDIANKKPNQISGGQAQRVAIARCLVTNPSIILADEPTGALDSENSLLVMNLLKELSKKCLVIVVTHNEELAHDYADRIIRLKDGSLISDEELIHTENKESSKRELKRSHLSFSMTSKLARRNLLSRKGKTILTGIANSFGMIGIGFFLAINLGFSTYSQNLSKASASTLPVVVTAYNRVSQTDKFNDKNASEEYPDAKEIYPAVDLNTEYSYSHNYFSPKYLSYLDQLKEEKIVRDYTLNYGHNYSFNLTTEYPTSLDGEHEGGIGKVQTTITSYNSYAYQASLPYNIFHVLYGDLEQYDLLAGSMPTEKTDLVLVVDKYNAISFDILQALGFYNSYDQEVEVQDKTLKTKVKPIQFTDIINREYKIFSNDEYFIDYDTIDVADANGITRNIFRYQEASLTQEFYQQHGTSLKIKGIIRSKRSSPLSILSPALCYMPSLQEELMPENEQSKVAQNIYKNLVFAKPDDYSSGVVLNNFVAEIQAVIDEYKNSKTSVLPTSQFNEVFERYFRYYPYVAKNYFYIGFNTFLNDCKRIGANLIDEKLLGLNLAKGTILQETIDEIQELGINGEFDKAYQKMISLIAYANAYATITSLVIFPVDLQTRPLLLAKLDEYNKNENKDESLALNEKEQVNYVAQDESTLLVQIGELISLISLILILFAIVSLTVSSSMTALLTSNNVLERKKEIGLLRSLGSRKRDVIKLFEIEAVVVGVISGVIGSLITFGLSFPVNAFINYYFSRYHVGTICDFTFYHGLILVGIGMLVGFIAALLPAVKASKQNPVDSLRSE